MRALFVAGAGLLAATSLVLLELRAPAAPAPAVVAPRVASREPAPSPPVAPPATVSLRPQIRTAVAAAAPTLHTQADVQRYLGDLEARARSNHQLTALEVMPGFAAICGLSGRVDPERLAEMQADYSQRMNRLADELAH